MVILFMTNADLLFCVCMDHHFFIPCYEVSIPKAFSPSELFHPIGWIKVFVVSP